MKVINLELRKRAGHTHADQWNMHKPGIGFENKNRKLFGIEAIQKLQMRNQK